MVEFQPGLYLFLYHCSHRWKGPPEVKMPGPMKVRLWPRRLQATVTGEQQLQFTLAPRGPVRAIMAPTG